MRYYISWTHSDPVYHHLIPSIGVLVSPPNVSLTWSVRRWPSLPEHLIVDSGAYQYYRSQRAPSPEEVLRRQLEICAGHSGPTGLCHLDVPLLGRQGFHELKRGVVESLQHAERLLEGVQNGHLPDNVYPIGVIQGYDVESVYAAAQALQEMGYTSFALGSLAALATRDGAEILRRVEAAVEAVGPNIHILGVSAVSLLPEIVRLGIQDLAETLLPRAIL